MDTKNIHQTAALRRDTGLSKTVKQMSVMLQEEIDLKTAKATWDLRQDPGGRPVLGLRIEDPLGAEAAANFAPEELRLEQHVRQRLRDMTKSALVVNKWRQQLKELFSALEKWLQDMKPAPFIELGTAVIEEQQSGRYAAPMMTVSVGNRTATIEPIAAWVVGADGRVDLRVPSDEFTFILQGNDWFWLEDRPPMRLTPLTKALFLELLRSGLQ